MTRREDPLTSLGLRTRPIPIVMLTHPFELALGAALVANTARAIAGDVSPSLVVLPWVIQVLYFAVSALGGIGVIAGVSIREHRRTHHQPIGVCVAIERAALFLVSASYTTLAIAVIWVNGKAGVGVAVVTLVVAAACILRAIAIRRAAKAILATLVNVNDAMRYE